MFDFFFREFKFCTYSFWCCFAEFEFPECYFTCLLVAFERRPVHYFGVGVFFYELVRHDAKLGNLNKIVF